VVEQRDATTALAGDGCAHQSGGSGSEDDYVKASDGTIHFSPSD
jgi:hypothetical protein